MKSIAFDRAWVSLNYTLTFKVIESIPYVVKVKIHSISNGIEFCLETTRFTILRMPKDFLPAELGCLFKALLKAINLEKIMSSNNAPLGISAGETFHWLLSEPGFQIIMQSPCSLEMHMPSLLGGEGVTWWIFWIFNA